MHGLMYTAARRVRQKIRDFRFNFAPRRGKSTTPENHHRGFISHEICRRVTAESGITSANYRTGDSKFIITRIYTTRYYIPRIKMFRT
jgi:hypothetical protein